MSSSKGSTKRSKFAELRALRQSGKKTFDSYEVEKVDSLYEEVDEDSYKKLVRERLNQDDFVVDDNGEGYADDGREDWDRVPVYDDSESDGAAPRKSGKSGRPCLLLHQPCLGTGASPRAGLPLMSPVVA